MAETEGIALNAGIYHKPVLAIAPMMDWTDGRR